MDNVQLQTIRDYIESQAELGELDVLFDEPWSLALFKKSLRQDSSSHLSFMTSAGAEAVSVSRISQFQNGNTFSGEHAAFENSSTSSSPKQMTSSVRIISNGIKGIDGGTLNLDAVQLPNRKAGDEAFLQTQTLETFYGSLAESSVYRGARVVPGQGAERAPAALLVLDVPQETDFQNGLFFESSVGRMLVKLLAALHIPKESLFVTYVFKRKNSQAVSPLLDTTLRQMLEKEISLLNPGTIIVFGESTFRQIFGRGKNFRNSCGVPLQFAGKNTVVLHDARAMLSNVSLKKETWNVFLPHCGYFQK